MNDRRLVAGKVIELHRCKTDRQRFDGDPPELPLPEGPYTVTVTDAHGKLWEGVFPESGDLPADANLLATGGPGMPRLIVNLLTGALRAFIPV